MAEVILMPRLSDTMTEGVIAVWHKKVGDLVKKGDLLAEVETDKATMELESYKDGTLLHIGTAQEGNFRSMTCSPLLEMPVRILPHW
jgi:pyruvate dehydrogenase E2 component (dihydrolipoamide acetyltransferase)